MKQKIFIPLIVVLSLLIGIFLGNVVANRFQKAQGLHFAIGAKPNKVDELMQYVGQAYVDSLDMDSISDDLMIDLLSRLDPHSAYIPAKDLEIVNSELGSSFSGIGVQFSIQNDTICIVSVINGGPSDGVGVLAGDRIITVDDSLFVGKQINNEKVMHTLRGTKGTQVKLGIRRQGTAEILSYTITRGDVPLHSVDAAYIVAPGVGFIRVSSFSENTYDEFLDALAKLRNQGAKRYVVDLRENTGGYMDQAINMANEFLAKGSLIVYSEGRAYPRYEAKANGSGNFQTVPLVVLINEFSASASEIFSGAMQDNDRALVVGRRSFGKGLVQQQFSLSDGSAVRLTVARYYTPAGRCIQKPYVLGDGEDYSMDLLNRFEHGEFDNRDSIQLADSTVYHTVGGRTVYGGGGIMPDIFVPRDTMAYTPYFTQVANYAYTYQFALAYTNQHRTELSKYTTWQEMEKYLDKQDLLTQFVAFAQQKGVQPNQQQIAISRQLLTTQLKAYIVRNVLNDAGFYPLFLRDDNMVEAAIKAVNASKAQIVAKP